MFLYRIDPVGVGAGAVRRGLWVPESRDQREPPLPLTEEPTLLPPKNFGGGGARWEVHCRSTHQLEKCCL